MVRIVFFQAQLPALGFILRHAGVEASYFNRTKPIVLQ